jgi:phosphotriesterase-related protein
VNIVVATGVYSFIELPPFLAYRSDDQIVELFVRELREGIDDTGIKAAFFKCCVEAHGIVGDIPRILSCVAAASIETDSPVMVHTNAAHQTGRLALDFLLGAGVPPSRIAIAHMGDSNDLDYQRAIADSGAWLGHDRFHIEHFNPDADRVRTLAALLAEGYAGQVHLGHDAAAFHDFMVGNPIFAGEVADWLHIPTTILPALLEAGVTQAHIDQMLLENPRRFFA